MKHTFKFLLWGCMDKWIRLYSTLSVPHHNQEPTAGRQAAAPALDHPLPPTVGRATAMETSWAGAWTPSPAPTPWAHPRSAALETGSITCSFFFFLPNTTEKKMKSGSQMGGKPTVGLAAPQPLCWETRPYGDGPAAPGPTRRETSLRGGDGGRRWRPRVLTCRFPFHESAPSLHLRVSFPEIKHLPPLLPAWERTSVAHSKSDFGCLGSNFQPVAQVQQTKSTACLCCGMSEFSKINEFEERVGLIWPSPYLTWHYIFLFNSYRTKKKTQSWFLIRKRGKKKKVYGVASIKEVLGASREVKRGRKTELPLTVYS